jgi:hypothetical protein
MTIVRPLHSLMKEIQQWIEVAARPERVRQFYGSS